MKPHAHRSDGAASTEPPPESGVRRARRNSAPAPRWAKVEAAALPLLVPLLAALIGLLVGAVMLIAVGASPLTAYRALLDGAVGDAASVADTLVKATPLLFVGVGICIAFRAGVINIGGEGQFIVGAIGATLVALNLGSLPGPLLITIASTVGAISGLVWGGIAGALKARLQVNEILTTVMLNVIAGLLLAYLAGGPLIDPRQTAAGTRIPETARFPASADLPRWAPYRLHLGLVIAIIIALVVWVIMWRTPFGYRIRAVGLNPFASRYAGISVPAHAMFAMAFSGAIIGLGGAIQVLGLNHRLFSDGAAAGFTGQAGYNGIVVALFGGLHPLGAIPASVLFGGLLVGANGLQRTAQVPSSLAVALNGIVVLVVVSSQFWLKRRQRRLEIAAVTAEDVRPGDGRRPDGVELPEDRPVPVTSGGS